MTDEFIRLKIECYEDELRKAYSDVYMILKSEKIDLFSSELIELEFYIQYLRHQIEEFIVKKRIKNEKNVDN